MTAGTGSLSDIGQGRRAVADVAGVHGVYVREAFDGRKLFELWVYQYFLKIGKLLAPGLEAHQRMKIRGNDVVYLHYL